MFPSFLADIEKLIGLDSYIGVQFSLEKAEKDN